MKKIIILAMFITSLNLSHAQKIEYEKVFGSYKFTQNENTLSLRDLTAITEDIPEAQDLIRKAKTTTVFTSILSVAGGGLIGWPLGEAIGGGDPNWALAGIGAGLVAVAIPLSSSASKKAKQAVDLYNNSLERQTNNFTTELNILASGSGLGLSLRF
ncbi:hypothetical protein [Zunongwangia sp. HGR-M22]|uniref:hypothetical protein n=1 Tax=Zunongwangia sp. HGR-M22 TaxID=3015168 RepID=UPI0022DDE203|nr:hypothetical protein [Zunongwangia sp. HGR-M22]WBL25276.1 hypothetical protein PBT91_15420 [Zunongwangia sp. HGR-M22]